MIEVLRGGVSLCGTMLAETIDGECAVVLTVVVQMARDDELVYSVSATRRRGRASSVMRDSKHGRLAGGELAS